MAGTNSLKRFLKKLLVQRNTKINKKRNGVVTLLWRLRLQENPDHKKFSSLYDTVVVIFYPYLYSWRRSYCSNLGGIPPKKSSRATLILFNMRVRLDIFFDRESIWLSKLSCSSSSNPTDNLTQSTCRQVIKKDHIEALS